MSKIKFNDSVGIFLLTLVSAVVVRQWFSPGLPKTHDAETHIARSAVFSQSIMEGNILPRWAGKLNWRYGTPSIMFLYPGVPYMAALVHLLTEMQFINIFKLFMIVGYIGSGIAWHRWMRALGFTSTSSFISSLFYLLAPYRLVNIFVRGALAEHLGFLFFPLIMLMGTLLAKTKNKYYAIGLTLSIAGLVLTHNLSTLLYLPFIIAFPFVLSGFGKRNHFQIHFLTYFASLLLGFSLTAFFWLPALMESKYILASWMFAAKDWYADHFLFPSQLIWSPWGYGWSLPGQNDGMAFQIGIAQIVVLLIGLSMTVFSFLRFRNKKFMSDRDMRMTIVGLCCTLVGIFLTLPISGLLWKLIPLMQKFQFPWRFLSYIVIGSSLAAAAVAERLMRYKRLEILIAFLPIIFSIHYWKIAGPSGLTEKFLTQDYVGTSDTGETTPVWAIRFQEKFPKAPVEVVSSDGIVQIDNLVKRNQRHEFEVSATANSQIADNTLYFPGWSVSVDGQKTPITYQDINWRGIITFPVTAGKHKIDVVFKETLLRKIADAGSLFSFGILFWLIIRERIRL